MKRLLAVILFALCLALLPARPAKAACFNPTGPVRPARRRVFTKSCPAFAGRPRRGAQLLKRLCPAGIVVLFLLALFDPGAGQAACFNPAGQAGDHVYNGGYRTLEYCNGGSWVRMGGAGNTTGGLVAWWKLDDGSGTSAADSTGNGNTGTLTNGPTWTSGMSGGALSLDGTNDYVNVGNQAGLYLSSGTISAWVKTTSDTDQEILGTSLGTNGRFSVEIGPSTSFCTNELIAVLNPTGPTRLCYTTANRNELFDGNWHHIAITADGASATKIYLDGVSKTVTVGTGPDVGAFTSAGAPTSFSIGSSGVPDNFFNGLIDDVRVYNRPLSAADVYTLYTSTGGASGDIQTGLIHYWKLDEASGTTAVDSINAKNATLTGTAAFTGSGKINGGLNMPNDTGVHGASVSAAPADILGISKLTMSMWFQWVSGGGAALGQQNTSGGGNSIAIETGYSAGFAGGGPGIACEISPNATTFVGGYVVPPQDTNWHMATLVFDGTLTGDANRLKCFVDGVQKTMTWLAAGVPSTTPSTALPFYLGEDITGTYTTAATIDDVRLYNRALSASDVLTLYNATATSCTGPTGYAGDLIYNAGTYHVLQFCNGTNWIATGKVPGSGGGGCSGPTGGEGDMIYSSDYRVMQYCDGTTWRAMGGTIPITGLVGWWNLDEGSGTSAADSSGNGNTGTTHSSPTWTTSGKINGALILNGTSQYVAVPTESALQLGGSWTVSAWINPSSTPSSGNAMIFVDKDGDMSGDPNYSIMLDNNDCCGAGLGWTIGFNSVGTTCSRAIKHVAGVTAGTWYHVTGVYDSAAQNMYLYLNGALVESYGSTAGCVPASGSGQSLTIGNEYPGGGNGGAGTVDDVRVYNRILSAAEVSRLYHGAP